jgi:RNase H-like domain found in reverse transcriptase/Integrase zinc binding domain
MTSGSAGVLEQEWPDGAHPAAYVSRKLSDPERNYPTHDRELLVIIHVIRELRCYLHGTTFTIQTNHHPLRYLDTQPHLSKREIRWLDALAEYDYVVKYIRGKWKILADAFSRRSDGKPQLFMGEESDDPALQLSAMTASTIGLHEQVLDDLVKDYLADTELRDEYLLLDDLRKQDGLLYNHLVKLVVPDGKSRMVLMHDYHDPVISGHLGLEKILSNLQKTFKWPGVRRQFTFYVKSCDQYQRNKSSSRAPAGLL